MSQMEAVAREAHVSVSSHTLIASDKQAIAAGLGPSPNIDLGDAAPRDPLNVYVDGQVSSFVHRR